MAKSNRGKSTSKKSTSKKSTSKKTATSSKKTTGTGKKNVKTGNNKKPQRKDYKTDKEYKEALKKYNNRKDKNKDWAVVGKSPVTKKPYSVPSKNRTDNYVQAISHDTSGDKNFMDYHYLTPAYMERRIQATNGLATTATHSKSYTDLPARTVNSTKGDPLVPVKSDHFSNKMLLKPSTDRYKNLNLNDLSYTEKNELGQTVTKSRSDLNGETVLAKDTKLSDMMKDIHTAVMLPPPSGESKVNLFNKMTKYYNRFKLPDYNLPLQKGFAHVFFVRPSCHILNSKHELVAGLQSDPLFDFAANNTPNLLGELVMENSQNKDNEFMMSLSNFVTSFSLSDEYIGTETYGRTFTGYKITYGKNDIESKTAGTIEINFNDDGSFHVYQIIRLWVEYINGVYRGKFSPANHTIWKKVLDYVGAIYYFVTAEDGETILFWSKYYGVFPSTIPSNQYSWGEGNMIQSPQISVTFNYSFKQDFNPYTILEFNHNARIEDDAKHIVTLPVYDEGLGHSSWKWGQKPFIELVQGESDNKYKYKLRFTKKK